MGNKEVIKTPEQSVDTKVAELQKQLEEKESKVAELENLIVKHKTKEKKPETNYISPEDLDKMLSERDFYKKNPEFAEHKAELEKYTSKGISIEEASLLVKANDETFGNRQKTNSMNITNGTISSEKTNYTYDELEKMTQSEYNKVKDLQAEGKVTISET